MNWYSEGLKDGLHGQKKRRPPDQLERAEYERGYARGQEAAGAWYRPVGSGGMGATD